MSRLLFSVCFLFFFFTAESLASDLCHFKEGSYYSRNEVMNCFASIPLDENVKIQTLDTLNKTKELYAFVDIAKDSPDPNLPLQVDIGMGLEKIGETNWQTAYEFHDALRDLYTGLGDAHTQYYRPACFQNFLIRQPIPPASYIENGVNKIFVSRHMSSDMVSFFSKDNITQYIGKEILKVDQIPAYNYFQSYADNHVGISKDPSTRFHLAMVQPQPQPTFEAYSPSYWSERTKRNPLPERDTVTYTLENVGDVTFEWTFKALKSYNGVEDFKADYYYSSNSKISQKQTNTEEDIAVPREVYTNPIPLSKMKKASSGEDYKLLINTDDVYFWALNDSKTLVMYLDTMLPETTLKTYQVINEGIEMAADLGLSRLIIDLTGNGGGSICFGRALLAYFQHQAPGTTNWGPQDLPLSPLQANLTNSAVETEVENTVWSPAFYRDQDGNHVANTDTSAIMPGIPHERGGELRNYSTLLHINQCGFWGNLIQPKKDFKPDDILILTHGFCGSTCALFANHAAQYDNIRTAVAGGRADRSVQQYSSFPGLQVLDDAALWPQLEEYGYDTQPALPQKGDVVPKRLPTTAAFRFCCREIYPPTVVDQPDTTAPTEFNFQKATYKIDDTMETAEDPYLLWYDLLSYF